METFFLAEQASPQKENSQLVAINQLLYHVNSVTTPSIRQIIYALLEPLRNKQGKSTIESLAKEVGLVFGLTPEEASIFGLAVDVEIGVKYADTLDRRIQLSERINGSRRFVRQFSEQDFAAPQVRKKGERRLQDYRRTAAISLAKQSSGARPDEYDSRLLAIQNLGQSIGKEIYKNGQKGSYKYTLRAVLQNSLDLLNMNIPLPMVIIRAS